MLRLLFASVFSFSIYAQSTIDKVIYLDSLWKETAENNHTYYRVIKDYNIDKQLYEINDFYKSGKLQMAGMISDKDTQLKKGEFIYYYENGNKKTVANFDNSLRVGQYVEWYEGGYKKIEIEYQPSSDPKTEGSRKVLNFWDQDNIQQVKDGNGYLKEHDIYTATFLEGKIKNGARDSIWTGQNKDMLYTFTETYSNGKLISGVTTDALNQQHNYNEILVKPQPKKGIAHFYKYVAKKLKIPRSESNISGRILLTFIIEKDGSVADVTVIKSLSDVLDNEAIKVIKSYPDWKGGELRGMPAKILYSLPIKIQAAE